MDPRVTKLAEQLITYSVKLQPGEKIYIEIKGLEAMDLGRELVRVATEHGGVPFWYYNDETLSRGFITNAGEEQFAAWGQFHKPIMEAVDAYIGVRGSTNPFDLADVDGMQVPFLENSFQLFLASLATNDEHAFLAFGQHEFVGRHAGLAHRDPVGVQYHARFALGRHLA